ncbi:kinase [Flaviflexus ciconiae]|uniref:Kinase n=1 Tax=Flaviflexus ciconiae TaxID=2496867 RepID=A0A3Q9G1L2_9ACTO|nr:aminoglycoside phosphotransferase family protein [Flaviflexus ciconiae]AZQ76867.1 kinase [Flaviflexus ciconiae]
MTIEIPPSFAELLSNRHADPLLTREFPRHGTSGTEWLEALPRLLTKALNRWELTVDDADPGYIRTGNTAVVIDVLKGKKPAVLKLSWPFMEGAFEHLALREWDGVGAVRLEAAEPRDYALLLERLDHRRSLAGESILDACEVIGTLINTLDRPASPKFQTIAGRSKRWEDEFAGEHPRVPRRLLTQAGSHLKDLVADLKDETVDGTRLIHTDLHDTNVLTPLEPGRGNWLAIDPQAVAGEPAFAVAPMVWNRAEETAHSYNARNHVRMRADIISDVAGLDEERVRVWTFVRLVQNAVWAANENDEDGLTRYIFLAKMFAQ